MRSSSSYNNNNNNNNNNKAIVSIGLTLLLVAALCASLAIIGRYTAARSAAGRDGRKGREGGTRRRKGREGMMFGFDATSDDLVGGYTDRSDKSISDAVKWKVKKCSMISDQDLARAVADAKRSQSMTDSRTFIAPLPPIPD